MLRAVGVERPKFHDVGRGDIEPSRFRSSVRPMCLNSSSLC